MAILKNTTVNDNNGVVLPSGTTAERPINIYDSAGSYSWTVPAGVTSIRVLVVGGGGSGGGDVGGGGAGGRVIEQTVAVTPGQTASITVGAGGAHPGAYNRYGNTGGTSTFSVGATTITCLGGNGGNGRTGGGNGGVALNTGWNGGGGSYDNADGTAGTGGFSGGRSDNPGTGTNGNGGGAGAGGYGENGFRDTAGNLQSDLSPPFGGGDGGLGVWSNVSGAPEVYAGGGGGSYYINQDAGWAGRGSHGGGHGSSSSVNGFGTNGRSGYGCGGGGGPSTGSANNGGQGGDGCVIINYANPGEVRFNTDFNEIEMYNGYMYVNPQTGTWSGLGKTARTAALSATQIKENYPDASSGTYWIMPERWKEGPVLVYCDMEMDGGGWMQWCFTGTLATSDAKWPGRKATTAKERTYWMPLFNRWGEIQSNSNSTFTSYSRPDFIRAVGAAGNDGEFMVTRVNDPDKVLIVSVENLDRYDTRWNGDWTFPSDPGLVAEKMLMSRTYNQDAKVLTDKNYNWSDQYYSGYLYARYENGPNYPGIAWNSTFNRNSDNDGGFETYLNRRAILYWDTQNNTGTYTDNQWWHGTPMELHQSSGPTNGGSRLDIPFYFRERRPNDVRLTQANTPGLTQDYPARNAVEIKTIWPAAPTGLYWIRPDGYAGAAQQIFCEMEEDGGGWMMLASNNARDNTIPGGQGRNNANYELPRNGQTALVGNFGIGPEGDYIIGTMVNSLEFGYARVVGWGWNSTNGTTFYPFRQQLRGQWVKAFWQVDEGGGVGRLTQIRDRQAAGTPVAIHSGNNNLYTSGVGLSASARYFLLDGVMRDGQVSGYGANTNQSTVGGVGVANSNGDPQSGCYLGHGGSGEATSEGWYNEANTPADSQGYTTWVK